MSVLLHFCSRGLKTLWKSPGPLRRGGKIHVEPQKQSGFLLSVLMQSQQVLPENMTLLGGGFLEVFRMDCNTVFINSEGYSSDNRCFGLDCRQKFNKTSLSSNAGCQQEVPKTEGGWREGSF